MQFKLSGAMAGLAVHGLPISLNFTTSARIRGAFKLEDLQKALERLREVHPLLAVRIDPGGEGGYPCFTTDGVPPIPLRVVERRTDQDWAREVEREIAIPTDYRTGPFFRCVWLRGEVVSDLVLVSDHVTADGYAGIYALRDLLRMLADPGLSLEPASPPRMIDVVPPAMQKMVNEKILASTATPFSQHDHGLPDFNSITPLGVIPLELDRDETAALVERCRREGTTVQAALCAAFSVPFAERQPAQPVRCIETPYNLRNRLLRPVDNVYGVFISLVYTRLDCTPGRDRWEIARQASQSLANVTEEQLFSIPIVMMQVADHPLTMPVVNFDYDLSISNLGRVNIPARYGNLTLESIYAPTMNVDSPVHRILGVTTFDGIMRCTYTSRDPRAPDLTRRSLEILAEMVHQPVKEATP